MSGWPISLYGLKRLLCLFFLDLGISSCWLKSANEIVIYCIWNWECADSMTYTQFLDIVICLQNKAPDNFFSGFPSVPANHQVCLRTDVKATRGQKTRSKQTPLYLLRTRWIINFHFCGVLVVGGGLNGGWFLPSRDNMESMALSAMSPIGRPRIYSILIATICWAWSYPTRPTVYPSYPAESRVWRDVVVLGYLLR